MESRPIATPVPRRVPLSEVVAALDGLWEVPEAGPDPAMSRFVPLAYDPLGFDWRGSFEPSFRQVFNGLMLRGAEDVGAVYCSVFPTPEVLARFLALGEPGDLLLLHHPIDWESGDPRGEWGHGLLSIDPATLAELREGGMSVYSCHWPMDYHVEIGTTAAVVEALGGTRSGSFFCDDSRRCAGWICDVTPTSTGELVARLERIFRLPYVDLEGPEREDIGRLAVVAGAGDNVGAFREAEGLGAEAYVSGEIHMRVDNPYGHEKMAAAKAYMATTGMSMIGVSHAASEYLLMETQVAPWIQANLGVAAETIPLDRWWR